MLVFSLASLVFSAASNSIISNGEVILGVFEGGSLNVPYYSNDVLPTNPGSGDGGKVGLRDKTGVYHATEAGAPAEGWGVWGETSSFATTAGGSNIHSGGLVGEAVVSSFETPDLTKAKSTVQVGFLEVVHDIHPSSSEYLYEFAVSVTNTGSEEVTALEYRRVMDWDIWPTLYNEYTTIRGVAESISSETAPKLIESNDNGFCSPIPTASCNYLNPLTQNTNVEHNGPQDHGAQFTFDLGTLAPGESVDFSLFYGVAPDEDTANSAAGEVKVEVYSYGQSALVDDGEPMTFIFGFAGVGGKAVHPPSCIPHNVSFIDDWIAPRTFWRKSTHPNAPNRKPPGQHPTTWPELEATFPCIEAEIGVSLQPSMKSFHVLSTRTTYTTIISALWIPRSSLLL